MSLFRKVIAKYLSLPRTAFWLVVIGVIGLSLVSKEFLSGAELTLAGCVQAALSILAFHFVITLFLYRKYQSNRIQEFMESTIARTFCMVIFLAITIFLVYGLYFFFTRAINAYS